jgi:plasmid maintenance system antidote protein VapI
MANEELGSKLRGKIAEAGLLQYQVAAAAEMHPVTLSQRLKGRLPLTQETASRIRQAIERLRSERSAPR